MGLDSDGGRFVDDLMLLALLLKLARKYVKITLYAVCSTGFGYSATQDSRERAEDAFLLFVFTALAQCAFQLLYKLQAAEFVMVDSAEQVQESELSHDTINTLFDSPPSPVIHPTTAAHEVELQHLEFLLQDDEECKDWSTCEPQQQEQFTFKKNNQTTSKSPRPTSSCKPPPLTTVYEDIEAERENGDTLIISSSCSAVHDFPTSTPQFNNLPRNKRSIPAKRLHSYSRSKKVKSVKT